MSFSRASLGVLAVIGIFAFGYGLHAGEKEKPLRLALDESQYAACGLDKLTDLEQQHLFGLVAGFPGKSFLFESAAARLQRDGWKEIRVLGALIAEGDTDDKLIVVLDEYDLVTLDPTMVPHLPRPGVYWAKSAGSSWTILFPDGAEGTFWARDSR